MPSSRYQRNVPLLYAMRFCENLFFITPVIVLFFQHQGLSLTQVMVLQTVFAVVVAVMEIPSGFFADRLGRRLSLALGGTLVTVGAVIYATGSSFARFAAAESVWAVGLSLISGADTALLYDSLKVLGRESEYKKIEGHAAFLGMAAAAAANVAGGLVGSRDLRTPFILMVPAFAFATTAAFFMREPPRERGGHRRGELYYLYKIGRFALYKNAEVRWLLLLAALLSGLGTAGFWLYQPYFQEAAIPVAYFGLIFALFQLFAGISGKAAFAVEHLIGKKLALASLPALTALAFFAMAAWVTPAGFLFVLFLQFVRGFSNPVIQDYINRHTWSDKRATVMSIKNFLGRLVFIAVGPLIGWTVDANNVRTGYVVAGAVTLVAGAALVAALRKDKVI